MSSLFKHMILAGLFSVLACAATIAAAPPGFVEGHMTIVSSKEVQLADGSVPAIAPEGYAEFPLLILSRDGKTEIARVVADRDGNYRAALPPGDYVLDVHGRARGHVRAQPKRFRIVSKQTARVDMDIDTGVR